MRNFLLILFITIFLNGCAQTTAMLGPALTVGASGGSIYQAGAQFGANMMLKDRTGKSATDHAFSYVSKKREKNLQNREFKDLLESHVNLSRKKIFNK